ncbi:polyunsaturated fatty acid 5-lipoxygenase [Petromyzon marinus]|uniref:polyunsaturated fatty acid 5-lipoxygenase n=1 Tax=Petromyzon marinus TaxID=7757 RepID=UPI003F7266CD
MPLARKEEEGGGGAVNETPSRTRRIDKSSSYSRVSRRLSLSSPPSPPLAMSVYVVTVATGTQYFAGTDDYVYITLVGARRSTEKHLLDKPWYNDFENGAVDSYSLEAEEELGDILLVKIQKRGFIFGDDWYCKYVHVKTPKGEHMEFPCYRWFIDDKEIVLREGKARLAHQDTLQVLKQQRLRELEERQQLYRWQEWQPGFLGSIDVARHRDLPRDIQFDSEKGIDFLLNYTKAMENLCVNQFMHMFQSSWSDFADYEKIFVRIKNTISEYVMKHWQEDFMFGYQFLNGCNPVVFKKCTEIPAKLPVTHEMVEACLERSISLEEEAKQGNIFIADYSIMDGIQANSTDPCTMQYVAAPICLLYNNVNKKLVPIAIQLQQTPGSDNPIFLPTDSNNDWMLAKMWARSCDFHVHQTVSHLLHTHLISEVFGIAMFRQLPAVHPIFKLLVHHTRFTIAINTKAREELICKCGLFDKANATGGGGHVQLVQRAVKELKYEHLQFPKNIQMRGVDSEESLPYYFYRKDGQQVWNCTAQFVKEVLAVYYPDDKTVKMDSEVQAWINDIFVYGFRNNKDSGIPQSFETLEELELFITTVIFATSANHAAVNFGQYDWYSWIPNASPTMRQPPPTEKGVTTMDYIIASLADRGRSCWHLGAVWALSQFQENEIFLGNYPDQHFTEMPILEAIARFKERLQEITSRITERNRGKKLPYYYLSPDRIPNSVAV